MSYLRDNCKKAEIRLLELLVLLSSVSLPPATKLRQGNVFTPVCDSVHRGRVSVQGGLFPGGVSVQEGVSVQGDLCLGGLCLCPGGLCLEGLCPGGLILGGQGVSVQGGGGSLCRGHGVSVQVGSLSRGSLPGRPTATLRLRAGGTHPTGMNAFLF